MLAGFFYRVFVAIGAAFIFAAIAGMMPIAGVIGLHLVALGFLFRSFRT